MTYLFSFPKNIIKHIDTLKTKENNLDLILNLEESILLIKDGLAKVQSDALHRDEIILILHALSFGFEKLLKSIILIRDDLSVTKETAGYFEGQSGHDLVALLIFIRESCFSESYIQSVPAGRADRDFFYLDQVLALFEILTFYSQKGRYDKIENILKNKVHKSPEELWYILEQAIISQEAPELFDNLGETDAISSALNLLQVELVVMVERTVRAFARLLTIGGLAGSNKSLYIPLKSFLSIQDDKLGHHQYGS